jgi:hypothetical protein
MGSKLRRRALIPEDEMVQAVLAEPKVVHGQFGRQVETKVRVTGGEYRGNEFKDWFSFAIDKDDNEEYIPYGGPLYQALAMVRPDIDEILDDDDLTEKKYQTFIKDAVKKLDGFAITGRVGIKVPKNNPDKKRNMLQPGTFGPILDPEENFADIEMEKAPS